jgi:putative transposase
MTMHLVAMSQDVSQDVKFRVYALSYHLILVTKYRRKCITAPMLTRLREITEQRCRDRRGTRIEFNGESDHIHF